MAYKHRVESRRDVIFQGMVYHPDMEGIVELPGILENADVVPLDRPGADDSGPSGEDDGSDRENAPMAPLENAPGEPAEADAGEDETGNAAETGDDETGNDPGNNEGDE